jgi:hypothetical protein
VLFPSTLPVDPGGTQVLLPSSGLTLYPIAGGAPKTVDAQGVSGSQLFAANGDMVYSTTTGAVSRYSASTGASTTLLTTGSYKAQTLSPDGKWMQLFQSVGPNSGSDEWVASATTAGTATSEWTMTTASPGGFTSDGQFELFSVAGSSMTSDLYASPSSGAPASKIATVASALALPGSVIAITENYTAAGTADIETLDVAHPTAKKTLVTGADVNMQLTPANQIVYSWHCRLDSNAGIWVAPLP